MKPDEKVSHRNHREETQMVSHFHEHCEIGYRLCGGLHSPHAHLVRAFIIGGKQCVFMLWVSLCMCVLSVFLLVNTCEPECLSFLLLLCSHVGQKAKR